MGFPNRYPHLRFGMEYERLSKSFAYGLHKIDEMVINNDPCYAYLLQCNNYVDVERFIDICLSIDDLIDQHSPFIERRNRKTSSVLENGDDDQTVKKIKSEDYMDEYINPEEFLQDQRRKLNEDRIKKPGLPESPGKDMLPFLIENAPLENWPRAIVELIREESYYFAPQEQTKIMNEGWGTCWHSTIMTRKTLRDSELIDYADHQSGTVATQSARVNPCKLGDGMENLHFVSEHPSESALQRGCFQCLWPEAQHSRERDLPHPALLQSQFLVRLGAVPEESCLHFETQLRMLIEHRGGSVTTLAGVQRPRNYTSQAMIQFASAGALQPRPGKQFLLTVVTPLNKTEEW